MQHPEDLIIEKAIAEIADAMEMVPGVVIIHDLRDWTIAWMSENGLKLLGLSLNQVTAMSYEEYFSKYFNREDTDNFVPKILNMLQHNNTDDLCTFFHQVRFAVNADWNWYMGSVRILARNDQGNPLLVITVVLPIDSMHHMTSKAERLLAENNFLRKNVQHFAQLSKREREILRLIALGKSNGEISDQLFISLHTAETHRKNIRRKLGVNSFYELNQYALAFDLI